MKYNNVFDTHTHSRNSFDGNDCCIDLCKSAVEMGAIGIAVTDHCDIDAKDYDFDSFAVKQFKETAEAKQEYDGKITVLLGIELGQGIYEKKKSIDLLSRFDYDIVIGSIHNLKDTEDFYFLDYTEESVPILLNQYFEAELELAQWNVTDTLAHLTYPLRYIYSKLKLRVDLKPYYDVIDAIFAVLIRNDKALELNTSGLFMDIGETLPDENLIKRYHDMGGKLVTVGSDSHYSKFVTRGILDGYDILKRCGYTDFTIFEKRVPRLIPIK